MTSTSCDELLPSIRTHRWRDHLSSSWIMRIQPYSPYFAGDAPEGAERGCAFPKPPLKNISDSRQSTGISWVFNFAMCANVCTFRCVWRVQSAGPVFVCDAAKSPDLKGSSPRHTACEQSRLVRATSKDLHNFFKSWRRQAVPLHEAMSPCL